MELILALAPVLFLLYSVFEATCIEKTGIYSRNITLPKGWIIAGKDNLVENDCLSGIDLLSEPKIELDNLRKRLQYKYIYTKS